MSFAIATAISKTQQLESNSKSLFLMDFVPIFLDEGEEQQDDENKVELEEDRSKETKA